MKWFQIASLFILCVNLVSQSEAFNYEWEIDETPQGYETATLIEPLEVVMLDEVVNVPSHSSALGLMHKYSVYLGSEWDSDYAGKLYQTFESVPQETNHYYQQKRSPSLWKLTHSHLEDDIVVEHTGDTPVVTIAAAAFRYATPRLAEIEGVRGRFFSKRLHRAVVRFVTDDGTNRSATDLILRERYAVTTNVPDYVELTRHTTGEHAGRFGTFKNEEMLALISMLEEFPTGMLKTPGLKYLVRRLDGIRHPLYPQAAAVAWTHAGYIEFMSIGLSGREADAIHRLILHEKAHFLWEHLFDDQLKQDWIKLGGWYETEAGKWATTQTTQFVSAYAHGHNPNEDMAESISYYIVNPDKLRAHAAEKYQFIQERIMHGTRYISKIREDLTFEVYNLYPDVVYPGRIIRVKITVTGAPEEDKLVEVEIELHKSEGAGLDSARGIFFSCVSTINTRIDMGGPAIDEFGNPIPEGHLLRARAVVSRYAKSGYWIVSGINLSDAHGNSRHQKPYADFGWKLYINNSLEDTKFPEYVKNSMRLSLEQKIDEATQRPYQDIVIQCQIIEERFSFLFVSMNDSVRETYPYYTSGDEFNPKTGIVTARLRIADYHPTGFYKINGITITDVAGNGTGVIFTDAEVPDHLSPSAYHLDEEPATIYVKTATPDIEPPVVDVNKITVDAVPTRPDDPNGETIVDISFRVKDNISGYSRSSLFLRDPHGQNHYYGYQPQGPLYMYFIGDPTVYQTHHKRIVLPVGSVPGIWGLAQMTADDKAGNWKRYDFTEIVRFEILEVGAEIEGVQLPSTVPALDMPIKLVLSVPGGISLIHVPLRAKIVDGVPQPLATVGDLYDVLGGEDTVMVLITYDRLTERWSSYFGRRDRGSIADRFLADDLGIIVSMKAPVSVVLEGHPLGFDKSSAMMLQPGLNLVGVPLNDERITRVSDLLTLDGIRGNVSTIIVSHAGKFWVVAQAGDPGDVEITGGQSFIMTAQSYTTINISGEAYAPLPTAPTFHITE